MSILKNKKNILEDLIANVYAGEIIDSEGVVALFQKLRKISGEGILLKIVGIEGGKVNFPVAD
jgi:hypothetical protein